MYASSQQVQQKLHDLCVPVFNHHLSSPKPQSFMISVTGVVAAWSDKIQSWLQQYTIPT